MSAEQTKRELEKMAKEIREDKKHVDPMHISQMLPDWIDQFLKKAEKYNK